MVSGKFIDISGKTFGKWYVKEFTEKGWLCICECGRIKYKKRSYELRNGQSRQCLNCSCKNNYHKKNLLRLELDGIKKNKIEIISFCKIRNNATYWNYQCACGNFGIVCGSGFKKGKIKQCKKCAINSLKIKNATHGLTKHPLHKKWCGMVYRCHNKENKNYHRYGGRGIEVCQEWRNDFLSFYNWALKNGWSPGLECDRIDNDGNYSPNNCQFIPRQGSNGNAAKVHIDYKKTIQQNVKICKQQVAQAVRQKNPTRSCPNQLTFPF